MCLAPEVLDRLSLDIGSRRLNMEGTKEKIGEGTIQDSVVKGFSCVTKNQQHLLTFRRFFFPPPDIAPRLLTR